MDFTQAPEIVAALIVRARTISGLIVTDGQPMPADPAPSLLAVGYSPTGEVSLSTAQEPSGLDFARRSESLSIVCMASAWPGGGTDMAQARVACVAILDSLKAALATDQTLGGTVTRASLGMGAVFDQAQTTDGAMVSAEFTVVAETL